MLAKFLGTSFGSRSPVHAGTTNVIPPTTLARLRLGMRPLPLILAIALTTALLAGCVSNKPDDIQASSLETTSAGDASSTSTAAANLPPKPTRTSLDVTAAVSQPWAKPGESVTLTATSAKATTYSWYLQLRPAAAAAPATSGGHSGHRALEDAITFDPAMDGPGHGSSPEPTPPKPQPNLNTGNIDPGQAKPLTFKEEGLYQLHCHPHPWMKVNVTVKQGASAAEQTITIIDGRAQSDYRYAPEDLVVAPGTKINFVNKGAQMHTATQEAYLETIPGEGKSVTFSPKSTGDYDVIVIARDATTGVGVAKARLLVDATKPDEKQPIGPYNGEFQAAAPRPAELPAPVPAAESAEHPFTSPYSIKSLKFTFSATSDTPVPPTVSVSLQKEDGTEIASAEPAASGEVSAADLPAGTYKLIITAGQGVMIAYEALGEALLDLQLPGSTPVQDESQPHGH